MDVIPPNLPPNVPPDRSLVEIRAKSKETGLRKIETRMQDKYSKFDLRERSRWSSINRQRYTRDSLCAHESVQICWNIPETGTGAGIRKCHGHF